MSGLHMKLNRLRDTDLFHQLIEEGKVKCYKPKGKVRGEWLLTIEALSKSWEEKAIRKKKEEN